ncbi:MAG: glycogen/starch/alpha-glucan family phosphorylase [Gammaproteobacteria bacterium]|nr:glycogen/starch/alpha-glucan family phosphorylase [Gammaproteobacteria bacterium]
MSIFNFLKKFRVETYHTALNKNALQQDFLDNLFYIQGKFPTLATQNDYYMALAYMVRNRLLQRWISTASEYTDKGSRTVAYLSAEFLMGPHLGNNLINLGICDEVRTALDELGLDFDQLLAQEVEPGLGNGGLGRLAACFLDSMATLEIPSVGYGIRYEYGIFDQEIVDGWQVEKTDKWLRFGNPWEIVRPEWAVEVKFGGYVMPHPDAGNSTGSYPKMQWVPEKTVVGIPYDTPILGYRVNTCNTLRLWRADAPESFDFAVFNRGDYYGAVNKKVASENISKVLYPNDEQVQGKELRLQQQYFFTSCSLQDMLRILKVQEVPLSRFHEKFTIQLNDTHPAVAISELMRLLIDEQNVAWDEAWKITQKSFAYTNHTLLPEALERWPLGMLQKLLPRNYEIILQINEQFLKQVRAKYPDDQDRIARMSIVDEFGERYVRMANLACAGSYAINGVAELHSELLKQDVLKDFYEFSPGKFSNKTNGVTPRRWMVLSNPRLSSLISDTIGDKWIKDLDQLKNLEQYVTDPAFCKAWQHIKLENKQDFAKLVKTKTDMTLDPASMFDVQVKRIHEYKRQHLNILHVIALYLKIKANPNINLHPRTFIFGGKAAPGYHMAKLIIKLINSVGQVVNNDPTIKGLLKVVYLPNFNVSNGHHVYPAAELSEQISTAGKEASGTGNMKFSLNGALTIGTLDGANIEIREEVGEDNFFLFGLTAREVMALKNSGYHPYTYLHEDPLMQEIFNCLRNGMFSNGDGSLFNPLIENLIGHDPYLVLADFQSYLACQERVNRAYQNQTNWTCMSILNTARSGKFSSDRSIREYSKDIWKVKSVPIKLLSIEDVKANIAQ